MTEMQSTFNDLIAKQVGTGIELARGKNSDQWIADRTKQLGNPLSRTAISEYRRGIRKTMPISDWLTIAAALGVPPVTLLFPGLPDTPSTLLNDRSPVNAFDAVMWVCGERQTLPDGLDVAFDIETGEEVAIITHLREYTTDLTFRIGQKDIYSEKEPSELFRLLQLCRKLRSTFEEAKKGAPWAKMNSELPEEVKKELLKSYMSRLEELSKEQAKIQSEIENLGGKFIEEKVIPNEEEHGER